MEGLTEDEIFNKENEEYISYDILKNIIIDWVEVNDKKIPKIDTKLHLKDSIGSILVRCGINRNNYKIPTGLYAVGDVNDNSPILVTCNYKLTFDTLRKNLTNGSYWILVLDTKGINVWCAAGKGTFSSRELIYQIRKYNLKNIVRHKKIILPQLGASSIEPHFIKKHTGFRVKYGPIRSNDIINYLQNNYEADEKMRTVSFNFIDRLKLTPLELILNMKYVFMFMLMFIILNIFKHNSQIIKFSILNTIPFILANISGSVVFPLILPILPFKSFALNGGLIGIITMPFIIKYYEIFKYNNIIMFSGITLLYIITIAYYSFNFTGSTTFTSFTGVKKETKIFLPILFISLLVGVLLTIIGMFL